MTPHPKTLLLSFLTLLLAYTTCVQGQMFPISLHGYTTCASKASFEVVLVLNDAGPGRVNIRLELLPFDDCRLENPNPTVVLRNSVPYSVTAANELDVDIPILGNVKLPLTDTSKMRLDTKDFSGRDWHIVLQPMEGVTLTRPPRPQFAAPPDWDSIVELVVDCGADVKIAGSLYLPHGVGPFPTVIVIQGSDSTSRKWSNRANLVIASNLAKAGIASFFYDDRGTGQSTGDKATASFEDSVGDILAMTTALKDTKKVDPNRMSLIGASEGSVLAAMATAKYRYRHTILLASPTTDPSEYILTTLTNAVPMLTTAGESPSSLATKRLAELFVAALQHELRPSASSVDLAAALIATWTENDKQIWDLNKLKPYLATTIESARILTRRQRSFYKMSVRPILEKAIDSQTQLLAIAGTRDRNPMCNDPDVLNSFLSDRPNVRVVLLPINHGLVDYGDIGSAEEFDIKQIISPRLLKELIKTLSK